MAKQRETLHGGPCDGFEMYLFETDMTVIPDAKHLRQCGVTPAAYDSEPMYIRCDDGKFWYHRDAARRDRV